MQRNRLPIQLLPACLLFLAFSAAVSSAAQEELSADEAARLLAEEEAAEALLPIDKKSPGVLQGRVVLSADVQAEAQNTVGHFVVKGEAYALRLARTELLKSLRPFNGKWVTLVGRIRLRKTCFIVDHIQLPVPGIPPVDRGAEMGM